MINKTIVIGCDHAGYDLKENLKLYLQSLHHNIDDVGTYDTDSVDYPIFGKKVAEKVDQDPDNFVGVLICGTGIGMSIVANRFSNVRAALVHNSYQATLSREHNDSNVLVLGAKFITLEVARYCCAAFLTTEFDGGRHQRRKELID